MNAENYIRCEKLSRLVITMDFIVFVGLFASFTFVTSSQQQVNESPRIAYNNPYLWMLSNQLFQLNTEVNGLKQKVRTTSRQLEQLSTLKNAIDTLTEKNKQQQQQIEAMTKNIREQEAGLTAMKHNCRCKHLGEFQLGWELYNEHLYYFGKNATWQEAKETCEKLGSHLVTIETKKEHSWIVRNSTRLANNPWIGLNDLNIEGQWRWVSDKSWVSFSAWLPGEPNSYKGADEDCVQYAGVGWNDQPCRFRHNFICEKA